MIRQISWYFWSYVDWQKAQKIAAFMLLSPQYFIIDSKTTIESDLKLYMIKFILFLWYCPCSRKLTYFSVIFQWQDTASKSKLPCDILIITNFLRLTCFETCIRLEKEDLLPILALLLLEAIKSKFSSCYTLS